MPDARSRFGWHPEPALFDLADAETARPALERFGHETWAAALDYLYDEALVRAMGQPAGYGELRERFFGPTRAPAPAPTDPTTSDRLLAEFRDRLAPHMLNAWHPRAFSYFTPTPLVASIAGEVLSQWANQGVDVWHAGPVAAFVEEEVVRWLCDLVGYDDASFGLLTSGGVMANFLAMALVRDVHVRRLRGLDGPPRGRALENVRVYTSDQTHFSVARALDELGFPPDTLVVLPADNEFRLPADAVGDAVRMYRSSGRTPAAIAAVAGSTNTGSVDDVASLADLARREDLWLHVDAAYGAAARLSSKLRGRVEALEQADSVTVDPHKWFFQAYDIGGLVVRDGRLLRATFDRSPEYYRGGEAAGAPAGEHGPADEDAPADEAQLNFYKLGFEGTRRWRALKLWLSWKHVGSSGFARLVEGNVELAERLALRCRESDDFEAVPEVPPLSVVCFRHLPGGRERALELSPADLDAHQDRLAAALEASGDGWLSTTRLRGATYLRAGIVNYVATTTDADILLDRLRSLAAELAAPV
ncbi:MAG: pyridoxal phosphate-dependent decarboxylase family protein [Chloroflexota bacterium]